MFSFEIEGELRGFAQSSFSCYPQLLLQPRPTRSSVPSGDKCQGMMCGENARATGNSGLAVKYCI